MPIDVLSDDLIRLCDCPGHLPRTRRGKKVNYSTLYRWWKHGVRGIRLETIVVSGERYTSREALQRFFERQTAARDGGAAPSDSASPAKRGTRRDIKKSIRDAAAELIRAGA